MKPFNQGIKAFKEGRLDNPYTKDTKDHRDWEYGFSRAYFNNLNKIQQPGRGSPKVQGDQKEGAYTTTQAW